MFYNFRKKFGFIAFQVLVLFVIRLVILLFFPVIHQVTIIHADIVLKFPQIIATIVVFCLAMIVILLIEKFENQEFFLYWDSDHTVVEKILIYINIFFLFDKYGLSVINVPLG